MLSENTITTVQGVRLVHSPLPHPFHERHKQAAAANWVDELGRQPNLFDGEVMLAREVDIVAGDLVATCHIVPYSTFLFWRRFKQRHEAVHVFATAVPVSAQGAVITGRMSARTANDGLVYCPAGSFDPDDLTGGLFDPEVNMHREVAEETGLDLSRGVPAPGYHVLPVEGAVVIFRTYRFAEPTDALVMRSRDHLRADRDAELDDVFAIEGPQAPDLAFAAHMPPILAWHFAGR